MGQGSARRPPRYGPGFAARCARGLKQAGEGADEQRIPPSLLLFTTALAAPESATASEAVNMTAFCEWGRRAASGPIT